MIINVPGVNNIWLDIPQGETSILRLHIVLFFVLFITFLFPLDYNTTSSTYLPKIWCQGMTEILIPMPDVLQPWLWTPRCWCCIKAGRHESWGTCGYITSVFMFLRLPYFGRYLRTWGCVYHITSTWDVIHSCGMIHTFGISFWTWSVIDRWISRLTTRI